MPVAPLDTVLLEANDVNNGGDVAVLLKYSLLKIDAEGSEIGMFFFCLFVVDCGGLPCDWFSECVFDCVGVCGLSCLLFFFLFFFSLLLSPSLSPSTGILEGSLETIKSGRVKRMIIELAPDWWRNFHVSIEHGLSILQRVLEDGQFQGTCN